MRESSCEALASPPSRPTPLKKKFDKTVKWQYKIFSLTVKYKPAYETGLIGKERKIKNKPINYIVK